METKENIIAVKIKNCAFKATEVLISAIAVRINKAMVPDIRNPLIPVS